MIMEQPISPKDSGRHAGVICGLAVLVVLYWIAFYYIFIQ
jgi:hypothetical protein